MKTFKFRYFIPTLLLAFVLGCVFTGCQAQPAKQNTPPPNPKPTSPHPKLSKNRPTTLATTLTCNTSEV